MSRSHSNHSNLLETAKSLLEDPNHPLLSALQHNHNQTPHPNFHLVPAHLSHRLSALVSVTSGASHPDFPSTLLQYNLLTAAQLDELAVHYHQTRPATRETSEYPIEVPSWVGDDVPIETKRRRWGRFIGLRGCESPVEGPVRDDGGACDVWGDVEMEMESEREMLARMDREWEEALISARNEDSDRLLRWKAGGI
ncbi:hypothetical protein FQN54_003314 [Arachnomyces sp. PD_36]|nr:hypothetical protein FQN54_003314 [Arachnomyces sp. PD_36]